MRQSRAIWRSVQALAVAVACVPVFAVACVGLLLVVPAPSVLRWSRWLPTLARRFAGVSNVGVYWPPMPPLQPDEDGLYTVGDRAVGKPSWFNEFDRLLDWYTDDPGARRDLTWLMVNPVVGGLLGLAAPGLVGTGIWLAFTSWWPVAAVPVAVGILAAPGLVALHDRWTSMMLRAKHDGVMFRFWAAVRARLRLLWFVVAHFLVALATTVLSVLVLTVGVFPIHIWGLWVFLWVPLVLGMREVTAYRRRSISEWSGLEIDTPYLPPPTLPRPRPDGTYRHGTQLYKTPQGYLRIARYRWIMTDAATWRDFGSSIVDALFGLIAMPVALVAPAWALRAQARVSRLLLAPTANAVLAQRVRQLTTTRADATDAQAAELRRIERDLHDGAQARLVAMGLHLSAVEQLIDQDPAKAKSLVARTKDASAKALTELRDLVRGIHPPVLAERGLGDALRALALDSPLQIRVEGELTTRLSSPVESAVYFAVNELLTNVAKHADATRVVLHIRHSDTALEISVVDDGKGAASPETGTGLLGLQRRLATFDGTFTLTSPPGGPTIATLTVPT
nr:histidine kinase [Kibdelosporangium sp. MJ126-NF4]CEL19252.1 putative two-component system sensor kinase [Kibdelosporangium sp. MJ126-NF4]CTQ94949.1 putative two-component system sensor kinase [Kibdelosporangium sp. MJ126-NF4]